MYIYDCDYDYDCNNHNSSTSRRWQQYVGKTSNLGGRRCGAMPLEAAVAVDGFQCFQLLGLSRRILLPFLGRYVFAIRSPHPCESDQETRKMDAANLGLRDVKSRSRGGALAGEAEFSADDAAVLRKFAPQLASHRVCCREGSPTVAAELPPPVRAATAAGWTSLVRSTLRYHGR